VSKSWIDQALTVAAALVVSVASIALVGGPAGYFGAGLGLIMLAIAAVDARRFIIPDSLNAAGFALGLVYALAQGMWIEGEGGVAELLMLAALRAGALALIFFALRLAYARARGREGLGLGDVKLAAVAGVWLDWSAMPVAIEIAALSALAVYAGRYFVRGRPLKATTRLPFGLFFGPSIWVAWLIEMTVLPYWYG
jgi:leader peptidase (prepilin peptidase)/N-methyltransferase